MSEEYTKGPWREGKGGSVVADYPVIGMPGDNHVEYYGGHLICESVTPSNRRRIIACVNACQQISTEELEWIQSTGGMLGPRADIERIAAQKNLLLEAAINLRDVKGRHNSQIAMTRLIEAIAKVQS